MRVTQSMLANNTLRQMSSSYKNLGNIMDQLASGKKITRASQDPVVAMNGMRYRTQVTEIEQYKRNIGEVYNWMDTADAGLDSVTQTLHRIRELTVQASNDTYGVTQRANISKEINQLREHLVTVGNTTANNKFIFNGSNTTKAPIDTAKMDLSSNNQNLRAELASAEPNLNNYVSPYELTYDGEIYTIKVVESTEGDSKNMFVSASGKKTIEISEDGALINQTNTKKDEAGNEQKVTNALKESQIVISSKDAVSTNHEKVDIEVLKGVNLSVNINAGNVFTNDLFGELFRLEKALTDSSTNSADITKFIDNIDIQIDKVVNERAELGARYNRAGMIEGRIMEQEVIAKRIMSSNEDADMEKVIMDLKALETIHRASLAASARIMQPSLMDFLR
jgi:flagellar hook-associated protein 3 FlgL